MPKKQNNNNGGQNNNNNNNINNSNNNIIIENNNNNIINEDADNKNIGQLINSIYDEIDEGEEDKKEEKKVHKSEEEKNEEKKRRQEYAKKRSLESKKKDLAVKKQMREVQREKNAVKNGCKAFHPALENDVEGYRTFLVTNSHSNGYVISPDAFKILVSLEKISDDLDNTPVKDLAGKLAEPIRAIDKYKQDHAKTSDPAEQAVWNKLDDIGRNLVSYADDAANAYKDLPQSYKEKKCSDFPLPLSLAMDKFINEYEADRLYRNDNSLGKKLEDVKEWSPDQAALDAPYLPEGRPISESKVKQTIFEKLDAFEKASDYKGLFDYISQVNTAVSNPSYLNKEYDTDHILETVTDFLCRDKKNPNDKERKGKYNKERIEWVLQKYQEYQCENLVELHKKYQKTKNDEFWFSAEASALDSFGSTILGISTVYANTFCDGDNKEFNQKLTQYKEDVLKKKPELKEYFEKKLTKIRDKETVELGIADFKKAAEKNMPGAKVKYLNNQCTKDVLAGLNMPGMFINNGYIDELEVYNNKLAANPPIFLTDKEKKAFESVVEMNKELISLGREMQKTAYCDTTVGLRQSFEQLSMAASEQMICLYSNLMQKPEWHSESTKGEFKPIRESMQKMFGMMASPETYTTQRVNKMYDSEKKEAGDRENIINRAESNSRTLKNLISYKQYQTFRGVGQKSRTTLKKLLMACDIAKEVIEKDPKKANAAKLSCKKALRQIVEDRFGFGKDISELLGDQCYKTLFENEYRPDKNMSSVEFINTQIDNLPKDKFADYDIDVKASTDVSTSSGRNFADYKLTVKKKPVIHQGTLDRLNSLGKNGTDFETVSPMLRDTDKLNLLSHMFNTKKRGLINLSNSGSYKRCKLLLKDVIEKRDKLIEMVASYQEKGMDSEKFNTLEIVNQSAALKKAVTDMLPEMQIYFRGSEKPSLDDYWQDAGIARLSASKGIIDEFRQKMPDLTNDYAPEKDMRSDAINKNAAAENDKQIAKFTKAYEKAFREQREKSGYDRHRMAAREASQKRKSIML